MPRTCRSCSRRNLAIIQNAAQNNLKFKLAVLATGTARRCSTNRRRRRSAPRCCSPRDWAPVEVKSAATKKFQADLKKYGGYDGVPDFGVYTGYLTADLLIKGLQAAGKNLTRDGFITATKGLGTWDAAGLTCQPVDVSAAGFGKQPKTACGWYIAGQGRQVRPLPETRSRSRAS